MRLGQVFTFLALQGAMIIAPALVYAADTAEKKGGIPQLDPTYYPSQIFWLIVYFILMFVLMSKVALPPVAKMMDGRDDKVRHDLENANRARTETDEIQSLYNRALRDADEEARTRLNQVVQQAKSAHEKALSETQGRLAEKIAESEQFLTQEKDAMMKDVPAMVTRLSQTILGELKKSA